MSPNCGRGATAPTLLAWGLLARLWWSGFLFLHYVTTAVPARLRRPARPRGARRLAAALQPPYHLPRGLPGRMRRLPPPPASTAAAPPQRQPPPPHRAAPRRRPHRRAVAHRPLSVRGRRLRRPPRRPPRPPPHPVLHSRPLMTPRHPPRPPTSSPLYTLDPPPTWRAERCKCHPQPCERISVARMCTIHASTKVGRPQYHEHGAPPIRAPFALMLPSHQGESPEELGYV